MIILRILCFLPLWLAYSSVALVLDIIGLVIMVPLAACHAWRWRGSKAFAANGTPLSDNWRTIAGADVPRHITAWRGGWLTWLWGNEEDGVTGPTWWRQRMRVGTGYIYSWAREALSAYRWSALRNPSNNLRFIPGINPVIRPAAVRSWSWSPRVLPRAYAWPALLEAILTWQGAYSSIRLHIAFRGCVFRFWWGWKLKPEDAQGVPKDDMRAPRCGFATQFKRIG